MRRRRERAEYEGKLWRIRRVSSRVADVAHAAIVPVARQLRRSDARIKLEGPVGRFLHVVDEDIGGVRSTDDAARVV